MLVTLFSDASMCHAQRVGGWAAWIKTNGRSMRFGDPFSVRIHDITLAEAMAVVNAVHCGLRHGMISPGDEVLIQTDNDSVMGVLQGTTQRRATLATKNRRGLSWRALKDDVRERNSEIKTIAAKFTSLCTAHGLTVRWRHVKGHRGTQDPRSAVNSICDQMARKHMRSARGGSPPTIAEIETMRRSHKGADPAKEPRIAA